MSDTTAHHTYAIGMRPAYEWYKYCPAETTPYMALHPGIARHNIITLQHLLPHVQLHYAVKSNPDARLIHHIDDIVSGYEIASIGEYRRLAHQGVAAERILYSNPVKVPDHIHAAHQAGIAQYAFDSLDEIDKLARWAPGSRVYLRITVPDCGSSFPLSTKFGVRPSLALRYMQRAQAAGLIPEGITFHVGSQSEQPQAWTQALATAGTVIDALAAAGIALQFLDIGGGFPAQYSTSPPDLTAITAAIREGLTRHIPPTTTIIAEPGRYISADAGVITTSIIARERRHNTEWLFLDMGAFQGLIEPLEVPGWRFPIVTDKPPNTPVQPYVLTGPTCDPYDTIGHDYLLPTDLAIGDKLYLFSTGAYSSVYGSNFNGFEPLRTCYYENT